MKIFIEFWHKNKDRYLKIAKHPGEYFPDSMAVENAIRTAAEDAWNVALAEKELDELQHRQGVLV